MCGLVCLLTMSIRRYFKLKDSLSDPKGPLSSKTPSQGIALANKEFEKIINKNGGTKKHGQYGSMMVFTDPL